MTDLTERQRMNDVATDARQTDGVRFGVDDDGIARIVLDRPDEANTLTLAAATALAQAIDAVADAEPRVVLLTGSGRVFCAGGDIREFARHAGRLDALVDDILRVLHPALHRLAELPVPVVTAINGSVGGAGIGLALCGDFAYAAASMKLRTGYAAIGLSPDAGSSYFTARRIGAARAKQLFFLSDAVEAERCLASGLVDAVCADDRLLLEADALCRRLASASTGSLAVIKRLCDGAPRRSLAEHLALEKTLLEARTRTADATEGIAAFLERRAPRFEGD